MAAPTMATGTAMAILVFVLMPLPPEESPSLLSFWLSDEVEVSEVEVQVASVDADRLGRGDVDSPASNVVAVVPTVVPKS
ncbi:uncharacterized protein BDV17DRAFT_249588 [Aspergillus undulatus]|uniref:uncharacterized protein n=1 Tax=Aspergillus undulatus TaxID=1810928 RepID=UPI003CCDA74A